MHPYTWTLSCLWAPWYSITFVSLSVIDNFFFFLTVFTDIYSSFYCFSKIFLSWILFSIIYNLHGHLAQCLDRSHETWVQISPWSICQECNFLMVWGGNFWKESEYNTYHGLIHALWVGMGRQNCLWAINGCASTRLHDWGFVCTALVQTVD